MWRQGARSDGLLRPSQGPVLNLAGTKESRDVSGKMTSGLWLKINFAAPALRGLGWKTDRKQKDPWGRRCGSPEVRSGGQGQGESHETGRQGAECKPGTKRQQSTVMGRIQGA